MSLLLIGILWAAPLAAAPELEANFFAARPAVLSTGQLLGPSLGLAWGGSAWSAGLRAQLGFASEDDLAFNVGHTELRTLAVGQWRYPIGRGTLSLGAGAGLVYVREDRTRHQASRLAASGFPLAGAGSSVGPLLSLELGVRVEVIAGFALVLSGGPSLATVAGVDEGLRLGWSSSLGLQKRFGEDLTSPDRAETP